MSTARLLLLLRGNPMLMRNKLLSAVRRFAAGINVSPREVRLVIASRRRRGGVPVRVEWLGAAPLAAGAMCGAHLVDRAAVAAALSSLCARWPRRRAMCGMHCAMAVPGGTTAIATFEMPAAGPSARWRGGRPGTIDGLDELEPAMLDEAERLCGLERDALSVDWWAGDCGVVPGAAAGDSAVQARPRVTLAAAPRLHLEARVEVAAAAGIALAAVDGEPSAALRALVYAAEHAPRPARRYAAIWAGYDGVYGWCVSEGAVDASVRFPGGEHADLELALRTLAENGALDYALVGGDFGLLARVGLTLADIGERLGCGVAPFECAPFCCGGVVPAKPTAWKHDASFAVAFGLALRGVMQ